MSRYALFDRSKLKLHPLAQRDNIVSLPDVLPLDGPLPAYDNPNLKTVADRIRAARAADKPVILAIGAHVIKQGCSRFVIDLMQRGWITHLAGNGACTIHDFELALIGATSESV